MTLGEHTTEGGYTIPGWAMERVQSRLLRGEDWQKVATEVLRPFIPETAEDELSEVNDVLREAEKRNDGP